MPRGGFDPFDIHWAASDPLGREVVMLHSVERARAGKHSLPPEHLAAENVREVVEDPDRIDESVSSAARDVYYRRETDEEYPYARAVVDFRRGDEPGVVISWSRYETPVASYGIKYRRDGQ